MFPSTLLPRFESNLAETLKIYDMAVNTGQIVPDKPASLSDKKKNVPTLNQAPKKRDPLDTKARKSKKAPTSKRSTNKAVPVVSKDDPEPAEPVNSGVECLSKKKVVDNSTVYWMRLNRFCDNNIEFFSLVKVGSFL